MSVGPGRPGSRTVARAGRFATAWISFKNRKGPIREERKGPEDPAATYSPGPGGQVPSATGGLTSVFGMGTGMTLRR
jgi:hypothetical protein